MTPLWKSRLVKYGSASAVSLLLSWATLGIYGTEKFLASVPVERYRMLCDIFSVPGVLLIMAGLLVVVSNQGAFEGIGYAVKYAVKMLIPGPKTMEKYYDYLQRRRGKRIHGFGFLFVVGLTDLVIAGVFMVMFYHLYL